jgi:hypothetical protein
LGVPSSSNLIIDSQRLALQERPSITDIQAAQKNIKLCVALRRALSPSFLIRFVALLYLMEEQTRDVAIPGGIR